MGRWSVCDYRAWHMLGRVRVLTFVAVSAALAVVAGCASSSIKKSDYIARADAICTNAVRATRSIAPPAAGDTRQQQLSSLSAYLGILVPIVNTEASQIRALKRPSGTAQDKAALERYLGALAKSASDYRNLADAAKRGDAAAVASAEAALRRNPVSALATSYGLRACGVAGGTGA
jgi:hypothetical protein